MNRQIDIEEYLAQSATWQEEVISKAQRASRIYLFFAVVAAGLAVMAVGVALLLAPLKEVRPFVIQVDKATGAVEVMTVLGDIDPGALTLHENEAVTTSNLVRYVTARETYEFTDNNERWDLLRLWSDRGVFDQFRAILSDPKSDPRQRWVRRTIEIVSSQLLNKSTAAVRFRATVYYENGASATENFAAVVGFRYAPMALKTKDRFINPLGFQVVSYRLDNETI